jgi:hypothetical protein
MTKAHKEALKVALKGFDPSEIGRAFVNSLDPEERNRVEFARDEYRRWLDIAHHEALKNAGLL